MSTSEPSPEQLRHAAFEVVAECRHAIKEGHADLSSLESSVREYCTAVARLPQGMAEPHEASLKALMLEVEILSGELSKAHEAIRAELAGLGKLKQANVAYHRSYAIGPVQIPKEEDE